jgi:hypothetical protein
MLNVKVYIQTVDMFANVDHVIDVYFQFFPLYLLEVMCVCSGCDSNFAMLSGGCS